MSDVFPGRVCYITRSAPIRYNVPSRRTDCGHARTRGRTLRLGCRADASSFHDPLAAARTIRGMQPHPAVGEPPPLCERRRGWEATRRMSRRLLALTATELPEGLHADRASARHRTLARS